MDDKIKSYEDFENRLKDQSIPIPECSKTLQSIILERKAVYKPIYLRTSFIAIFLSVFITASVATAMQFTGFSLFNSNGEKVYEVLSMGTSEEFNDKLMKYERIIQNIKETIPEGKFVYFLPVDAYEELGFTTLLTLYNGTKIENLSAVPSEILESINLYDSILTKYNFSEGTIYYESPHAEIEFIAEEMYKEAKKNGLEYITQEGTLSSSLNFVELKYKINESDFDNITIRVSPTEGTMYTSENLEEYTKLTEQGNDFLYNKEIQKVLFIVEDNTQKMLVEVYIHLLDENFDEKKELLPITLSLFK